MGATVVPYEVGARAGGAVWSIRVTRGPVVAEGIRNNDLMAAIEGGVLLVLLVTVLGGLARRLSLPAPVLLAAGGLLIGSLPAVPDITVNPDLVQVLVLPPLLYAASLELPTRAVLRDWKVVAVLAIGLVLAATAAVGALATLIVPGLDASSGLVLGAILAAIDAVAVTALARQISLPRRLSVIIESESLFNDATALVAFSVTVGVVVGGGRLHPLLALGEFFAVGAGGMAIGLVAGFLAVQARRLTADVLSENALSLLTPFVAFLPAQAVHASGLTAVVVCGLYVSPRTPHVLSSEGRLSTQAIWAVLVYLLEGVVFALVGLQLPTFLRAVHGQSVASVIGEAALVSLAVIAVRAAGVFGGWAAARLLPARWRPGLPSWQTPTMLVWAGTRGVVALAAALSLPLTVHGGQPFPHRELLLALTTLCILMSLGAQGLTLAPLARRLHLEADRSELARQEALARHAVARVGLAALEERLERADVPEPVAARLRRGLEQRVDRTRSRVEPSAPVGEDRAVSYRELRRELLAAERAELVRLRDGGEINDEVLRTVQRGLDIEESGLA